MPPRPRLPAAAPVALTRLARGGARAGRCASIVLARCALRTPVLLGLVIAAGAGAGCSSRVDPIVVGEECPQGPLRGPSAAVSVDEVDERLIDDFERGDNQLEAIGGRDGAWVLGSDGTSVVLTAESSPHCAARGREAGHFAGRDFTEWGTNWTAVLRQFVNEKARPYDASAYGGISFWAAVGGGWSGTLPFAAPVGVTTMDVAFNGGICTACMDYYRTNVMLTSRWERHEIRFDSLHQSGFGEPRAVLRKDQLVGFILWPPNSGFDIWIDDVRFTP